MHRSMTTVLGAALAIATVGASVALAADRGPTEAERLRIESVLKAEGYTTWKRIELDDGRWEVDDAVAADGRKFDVHLDPTSFGVTSKQPD